MNNKIWTTVRVGDDAVVRALRVVRHDADLVVVEPDGMPHGPPHSAEGPRRQRRCGPRRRRLHSEKRHTSRDLIFQGGLPPPWIPPGTMYDTMYGFVGIPTITISHDTLSWGVRGGQDLPEENHIV